MSSVRIAADAANASRLRKAPHVFLSQGLLGACLLIVLGAACSTLPANHFEKYTFPKDAYIGDVKARPYTVLGQVRSREDYSSLDPVHNDDELCRNYFNKGAADLLKLARKQDADAVIQIKSVTFNADGTVQTYDSPQCADDGQNGQVLMEGTAINWGKAISKPVILVEPSDKEFRALRLKKDEDGMDGGIYVTSIGKTPDHDLALTSVALYTMDRKVLSQVPVPAGSSAAWLSSEFLSAPTSRTVFMNARSIGDDVLSEPLSIDNGKLSVLEAVDATTKEKAAMILVHGKAADWRLTKNDPQDLLEVVVEGGKVTYTRFHLDSSWKDGPVWVKTSRTESGSWDPSKPFPAESEFPRGDYSAK